MPSIDFLQQVIYTLALSLLLVYLSRLPKRSLFLSSLLFILLTMGVNFIPVLRGSSLVEVVRGAIGDVSISSGALLLLIIFNQFDFRDNRTSVLNFPEKIFIVIGGILLYISTFGFLSTDLYAFGYLSLWMLYSALFLALLLIAINRRLGIVIMLALAGFYFRLQSSNNLWDYLLDPVLWLVLVVDLLTALFDGLQEDRTGGWKKY